MIAVILAGGYATRLYPLALKTAKPLLTVGGEPIIDHILSKVTDLAEIDQVVVATNTIFEDQIRRWLSQRSYRNVLIRAERSTGDHDKPGALKALADLVKEFCGVDYLVVAGDNLFTSGLKDFFRFYQERHCPIVALREMEQSKLTNGLSVIEVDSERRIIRFLEKPSRVTPLPPHPNRPYGNTAVLVGTCIYALPEESMRRLHEFLVEGENHDSPGYFLEWLCKRESVYGYLLEGEWWDIGTLESYEKAKAAWRYRERTMLIET